MKIKITITIEYEVYPQYFPKGATPEEVLAIDLKNAKEHICTFLDIFPHKITGEIIE